MRTPASREVRDLVYETFAKCRDFLEVSTSQTTCPRDVQMDISCSASGMKRREAMPRIATRHRAGLTASREVPRRLRPEMRKADAENASWLPAGWIDVGCGGSRGQR